MSRMDTRQLHEMLVRLADERDAQEQYFGFQQPQKRIQKLMNRSLESLMDRYDIREIVAGRDWSTHATGGAELKIPLQFEASWPNSWGSPWTTYGGISRAPVRDETAEEKAAREKAAKEAEEKREALQRQLRREWARTVCSAAGSAPLEFHPEPVSEARIPDYTHTLIGYRVWSVRGGHLSSFGVAHQWQTKVALKAECVQGEVHEAPDTDCECGYWSFKSIDLLAEAVRCNGDVVVGPVHIWGRVIECENGYRSEFCYPKELWLLGPGNEHLGPKYGVPIKMAQQQV